MSGTCGGVNEEYKDQGFSKRNLGVLLVFVLATMGTASE